MGYKNSLFKIHHLSSYILNCRCNSSHSQSKLTEGISQIWEMFDILDRQFCLKKQTLNLCGLWYQLNVPYRSFSWHYTCSTIGILYLPWFRSSLVRICSRTNWTLNLYRRRRSGLNETKSHSDKKQWCYAKVSWKKNCWYHGKALPGLTKMCNHTSHHAWFHGMVPWGHLFKLSSIWILFQISKSHFF